jgi:hypothetical protein
MLPSGWITCSSAAVAHRLIENAASRASSLVTQHEDRRVPNCHFAKSCRRARSETRSREVYDDVIKRNQRRISRRGQRFYLRVLGGIRAICYQICNAWPIIVVNGERETRGVSQFFQPGGTGSTRRDSKSIVSVPAVSCSNDWPRQAMLST